MIQIVDPFKASYGVENPLYAVVQLAQTTMRSELGKITLDKTFAERSSLNASIVVSFHVSSNGNNNSIFLHEIMLFSWFEGFHQ